MSAKREKIVMINPLKNIKPKRKTVRPSWGGSNSAPPGVNSHSEHPPLNSHLEQWLLIAYKKQLVLKLKNTSKNIVIFFEGYARQKRVTSIPLAADTRAGTQKGGSKKATETKK